MPPLTPTPSNLEATPSATGAVAQPTLLPGPTTTLRLGLPPRAASGPLAESMLDQVRNDPRTHTPPRTMEQRMADAMGTLPTTVQSSTSGTGSSVVRQGSKCTRVYDNRMKSLAPMDDRLKDAPSVAGSC